MLIIASCALACAALVVLFVKARSSRWAWLVTGLLAAAIALTAAHLGRVDRLVKQNNSWLKQECDALASELELQARTYRMWSADLPSSKVGEDGQSPTALKIRSIEDEYQGALSGRFRMLEVCTPARRSGWEVWDCLPLKLNSRTVQDVESAASAIRLHQTCDTRGR